MIGQTLDRRDCDEDQAGLSGAWHYRGRVIGIQDEGVILELDEPLRADA